MFGKVLVANRGEIAVRVIATLRAHGIGSVAVYSDAAAARHVREADVAIRIGPAPAAESYLHIGCILGAAGQAGAQAVHPGYGFLAENAARARARACAGAGLVFIGPPAAAIEAMGDKIRAKATVAAAGVPVVPGSAICVAMLFDGWPAALLRPAPGRALTLALTALALNRALAAYAGSVHWARASPYDWITTAALSFAGADIILHAGIGLRWPFTPKTTHDP